MADLPTDRDSSGFDTPAEATIGLLVAGRFAVQRILGEGAMARVYLAMDLETKEQVALKMLRRKHVSDQAAVLRFEREIDILAKVDHPALVKVIAFDTRSDARPWFAMEYVEGESLRARMSRGPMGLREIVKVIGCVATGLDAAHLHGVVHRDLTPENILLTENVAVPARVVDFGLSRFGPVSKLTDVGAVIGTPRYMAPEVVRSAETVDHKADIFSLGAIFFECLTGSSVYPAQDLAQLVGCILHGRVCSVAELKPDLAAFDPVVRRAMRLMPGDRYISATEFAEDIRHIADSSNLWAIPGRSPGAGRAQPPALAQPGGPAQLATHDAAQREREQQNRALRAQERERRRPFARPEPARLSDPPPRGRPAPPAWIHQLALFFMIAVISALAVTMLMRLYLRPG